MKLTTIVEPKTCEILGFEYDATCNEMIVDLYDQIHEIEDAVRVDGDMILDMYQAVYGRDESLDLESLIRIGFVNEEFLSDYLRDQLQVAQLTISEFADLEDDERIAWLNNIVVSTDDEELKLWVLHLLHYAWNGYPKCPNYHPEIAKFALRLKRVKPKEVVKDIFKTSILTNILDGHEIRLAG